MPTPIVAMLMAIGRKFMDENELVFVNADVITKIIESCDGNLKAAGQAITELQAQ